MSQSYQLLPYVWKQLISKIPKRQLIFTKQSVNCRITTVALAKDDFVSAGLSVVGVIPVVGEVADTAKLAKMADKAVDTAKIANKATDIRKLSKKQKEWLDNGHWKD